MATFLKAQGVMQRYDHLVFDITLSAVIVVIAAVLAALATLTGLLLWWESAAFALALAVLAIGILWTVESIKRQTR